MKPFWSAVAAATAFVCHWQFSNIQKRQLRLPHSKRVHSNRARAACYDFHRLGYAIDIKKKHSAHAMTADVDISETAKAAEFFSVDGVIVTGTSTGSPADPDEVRAVSSAVGVPTIVGSGITPDNIARYRHADALIVGSSVKSDGLWSGPLDEARTREVVRAFDSSR